MTAAVDSHAVQLLKGYLAGRIRLPDIGYGDLRRMLDSASESHFGDAAPIIREDVSREILQRHVDANMRKVSGSRFRGVLTRRVQRCTGYRSWPG